MSRHRPPVRSEPVIDMRGVLRRNVLSMAGANLTAAAGMVFADPGTSPSLAFLALVAPLPVWAVGFAAAGIAQAADRPRLGHGVALPLWLMLAVGAVIGLVRGTSSAPAASVIFTGLVVYVAAHHLNALFWRRQEARARRDQH